MLETDGLGSLSSGAATLTCDGAIGAAAIFSVRTGNLLISEAGVGPAALTSEFVIPVESKTGIATGLALFNPDSDVNARLTLRLLNAAGKPFGDADQWDLGSQQHLARFVFGPGQFFPPTDDFSGTLRVSASHPIVALTLRQNVDPLAYSTLPIYAISSPAKELIFPQVANGQYSDGNFRTAFQLFNFSQAAAQVTATFFREDGSPLLAPYSTNLAAGAYARLETDGAGQLNAGAARITSTQPLGVAASCTVRDRSGRWVTETGVSGAPALTQFSLPVDLTDDFDTGVAIAGPSSGQADVRMRLLDMRSQQVGEVTFSLAANRHVARFVSQWFAGKIGMRGLLSITASRPVAAVAMRQHGTPYALTTLPVASGAYWGP
jgi:hypothetical protein